MTPLVAENGCPGAWNYPTTDPPAAGTGTLEFVFINPHNVSTPVNLQGSGHEWQVTVFVVKGFTSNGGTAILGPVLADGGSMAGNTGLAVPPPRPSVHLRQSQFGHCRCLGRDARQLEATQVETCEQADLSLRCESFRLSLGTERRSSPR